MYSHLLDTTQLQSGFAIGKAIQVVMKLIDLTKQRQIQWERGSTLYSYQTAYNQTTITIRSESPVVVMIGSVWLTIQDNNSNVLHTLPAVSGLDTLFQLVHRQVEFQQDARLDEVLNKILS